MESYATIDEYRLDAGDEATGDERIDAVLAQQSAKLRAKLGIRPGRALSEDQLGLARLLVVDAARKCLVPPEIEGLGDVTGASQASAGANGFTASVAFSNPSGSAYFDRDTLAALRKSLGGSQRMGTIAPFYGAAR